MGRTRFLVLLALIGGCNFDPSAAQQRMIQGDMHLFQRDYRGAVGMYDAAINADPTLREAYFHRGIAYRGMGDFQKSYVNLEVAIKLDPNDGRAYAERARTKLEKLMKDANGDKVRLNEAFSADDPMGISSDLDTAMSMGNSLVDANTLLLHGAVRLMQNRDAEAKEDFEKYVRRRSKARSELDWAVEHWKKERPVLDFGPIDELARQMQQAAPAAIGGGAAARR